MDKAGKLKPFVASRIQVETNDYMPGKIHCENLQTEESLRCLFPCVHNKQKDQKPKADLLKLT